ncbi:MAG TPA: GNAT family N-acetyltransferase [Ktedonobacterales bacterium]
MPIIQTRRLTLVPFTLELVRAALRDREEFGRMLAARVPNDWPNDDVLSMLPQDAVLLEAAPQRSDWSYLVVHTGERSLIGDIGFHAPPDANGSVEIGYDILTAHRGQGYAVEAGEALLDWAFQQPGARFVVAESLVDNVASMRVLEKLGLRRLSTTAESIWWRLTREEWLDGSERRKSP